MKYLLDTNPCIVYLNGRSDALRDRIDSESDASIVVCSVVLAELFYGACKSNSPETTFFRQKRFLSRFRSLPFGDEAARKYGIIRATLEKSGETIGANDLMIAATALADDLTLVTHNTREFLRVPGLKAEDWELPTG